METKERLMQVNEIEISFKRKTGLKTQIKESKNAYEVFNSIWSNDIELREKFYAMYLDRRNRVIAVQEISSGGTTSCLVDTKIIFSVAVKVMAQAIIIAHNHPTGVLLPSQQDKDITKKIKQCSELFDMQLLDHLIVSEESYYSFGDECIL